MTENSAVVVKIKRDQEDHKKYIVTVCPDNEYITIEVETTNYLLRRSGLLRQIPPGSTHSEKWEHLVDFLKSLKDSRLTTEIVMTLLRRLLLLIKL